MGNLLSSKKLPIGVSRRINRACIMSPMGQPQAHYLRAWRKYRGLSAEALATKAGLESKTAVTRIERFERPYVQPTWEALAKALDAKPVDLFHPPPDSPRSQLEMNVRSINDEDIATVAALVRELLVRDAKRRA